MAIHVPKYGGSDRGDPPYQRMLDFLDGALPVSEAEVVVDADMMDGHAVFTTFEVRPLDVSA